MVWVWYSEVMQGTAHEKSSHQSLSLDRATLISCDATLFQNKSAVILLDDSELSYLFENMNILSLDVWIISPHVTEKLKCIDLYSDGAMMLGCWHPAEDYRYLC